MADDTVTLKELKSAVEAFETERNWRQFHSPKNLAMGIAIETGELLEHFQWLSGEESCRAADNPQALAEIKDEIADVFNYLLNLALVLNLDLSDAFYHKIQKNAQKYPADQYHGKYKI